MNSATLSPLPDMLLPWLKPEARGHLRCTQIAEREFRVEILDNEQPPAPGPMAMLGFARKFQPEARRTDDVLRELREGEAD